MLLPSRGPGIRLGGSMLSPSRVPSPDKKERVGIGLIAQSRKNYKVGKASTLPLPLKLVLETDGMNDTRIEELAPLKTSF